MAMMGQNIGAGNIERAKMVYKKALIFAFTIATVLGALSAIFSKQILGLFTTDPTIIGYAQGYFLLAPISFGFLSVVIVVSSSFQGVGKSWPGFWITFIKFGLIAAPLSYLLTKMMGYGIISVWIAIMLSNVLAAVIGYFWLKRMLDGLKVDKELVRG